jgi:nucleoside 2-deoxyribosyltransferase
MRGKKFLKDNGTLPTTAIGSHPMSSGKGIVGRDMHDVRSCGLMLVNLLDAPDRSIGTMVEYGWASAWGKPIITVKLPKGCRHDHLFIDELSTYQVDNVDAAIDLVKHLLLPGY